MDKILADKIQNYITNLVGGQITIADIDGKIVASNQKSDIGTKFDLSEVYSENITSDTAQTENANPFLAVNLSYGSESQGYVIINDEAHKYVNQKPLIKSLAELLIQQHLESSKPDLDSTDKFVCNLMYNKGLSLN